MIHYSMTGTLIRYVALANHHQALLYCLVVWVKTSIFAVGSTLERNQPETGAVMLSRNQAIHLQSQPKHHTLT
jgi:hypothetical protein